MLEQVLKVEDNNASDGNADADLGNDVCLCIDTCFVLLFYFVCLYI